MSRRRRGYRRVRRRRMQSSRATSCPTADRREISAASSGVIGAGVRSALDVPGSTTSRVQTLRRPAAVAARTLQLHVVDVPDDERVGAGLGVAGLGRARASGRARRRTSSWSRSTTRPSVRVRIARLRPAGAAPVQVTPVTAKPVAGSGRGQRRHDDYSFAVLGRPSVRNASAATPCTAYDLDRRIDRVWGVGHVVLGAHLVRGAAPRRQRRRTSDRPVPTPASVGTAKDAMTAGRAGWQGAQGLPMARSVITCAPTCHYSHSACQPY